MTYLGFHLRFLVPPILLLTVVTTPGRTFMLTTVLLFVVVMAFTAPWDNHAARRGIWGFPKGRYWFRIGYLPVEEYAFFWLQTALVGLAVLLALPLFPTPELGGTQWMVTGPILAALLVSWAALGWAFRNFPSAYPRFHYAWHLLYWFTPVIAAQWIIAWWLLAAQWLLIFTVTMLVGTYLAVADAIAIRDGIWYIDRKQSQGAKIAGVLPWEEALFFYLTSLLVAQSYLMLLPVFS